ncbi:MAG: ArsA family ATPase [Bradymonadaceae bacterium]
MTLYDRKLVFFSGKGGVGKTTVASGFALSCARKGERTLLVELDAQDRVGSYFGSPEVDTDIIEVEDNLHAVNVTPEAALEEYGLMILRLKVLYRAVFENRLVRTFIRAIPGLDELLMIGKAYYHANETDSSGDPVWDKVVVDAPATGHGLFLLQIPSVITSTLESGHMRSKASEILEFLREPERTALVLVTLAEEMPVNETLMMRREIRQRLELPLDSIFVNGLYPVLFEKPEIDWLEGIEAVGAGAESDVLAGMVEAARFRRERIGLQRDHLGRLLSEVDEPVRKIPQLFTERLTFPQIETISTCIRDQVEGEGLDVEFAEPTPRPAGRGG